LRVVFIRRDKAALSSRYRRDDLMHAGHFAIDTPTELTPGRREVLVRNMYHPVTAGFEHLEHSRDHLITDRGVDVLQHDESVHKIVPLLVRHERLVRQQSKTCRTASLKISSRLGKHILRDIDARYRRAPLRHRHEQTANTTPVIQRSLRPQLNTEFLLDRPPNTCDVFISGLEKRVLRLRVEI